MAAPNLISATTINGKTTGVTMTNTSPFTVLNNAINSGKLLKVNTLNVANFGANAAIVTVNFNTGASLAGSNFPIVGNVTVPGGSSLNVIDKTSQYYLEENTSIGAVTGTANTLTVTVSYEDIS